jgi:arginase
VRTVAATGTIVGLTITEFAPADQLGADEGSRFLDQLCEAATHRLG